MILNQVLYGDFERNVDELLLYEAGSVTAANTNQ